MLKKLFLLCAVLFTAAAAMAQVETITINFTPGAGGEASIKYMGINGNEELNKLVPIFIKASGWLKQVSSSADFDLRGVANSTTCEYIVSVGGAGETRGRVTFSNPREGAKKVVDAVLAVIFPKENVKELCQSKIAFCVDTGANRRNIYTCDIAGGDVQKLTDFNSLCVEPTWSPDATSIGYTKYTNSSTSILETRLNPLSTRVLTSFPGLNVGVSFSPDFKRIAFVGSFEKTVELYVKDIGSKSQTRLTKGYAVEASPCWNPAGDIICYVSNEGGRVPKLFTVNLAAKTRTRLNTVGSEAATPDWSVNNKIVYSAKVNGSYKLAVNEMTGAEAPRIVSSAEGEWESPSWAPDGRHVVCARTSGGKTALYIVDTISGNARLLLQTKNRLMMPSWSPKAVR